MVGAEKFLVEFLALDVRVGHEPGVPLGVGTETKIAAMISAAAVTTRVHCPVPVKPFVHAVPTSNHRRGATDLTAAVFSLTLDKASA